MFVHDATQKCLLVITFEHLAGQNDPHFLNWQNDIRYLFAYIKTKSFIYLLYKLQIVNKPKPWLWLTITKREHNICGTKKLQDWYNP